MIINIKETIACSYLLSNFILDDKAEKNCLQRAGLYAGWELEFRLPITAAD